MSPILARFSEPIYSVMRFMLGWLFACHGASKLFGAFGGKPMLDNPKILVAAVIEFVGGILIALGLLTSLAAFLSSGLMAFAYFMGHASGGFWPIVNKGELAVVYCFVFLYISAHGSGAYSLDRLLFSSRAKRSS